MSYAGYLEALNAYEKANEMADDHITTLKKYRALQDAHAELQDKYEKLMKDYIALFEQCRT